MLFVSVYQICYVCDVHYLQSECIKTACEMFVNRHNMAADIVANLEAQISLQMGLVALIDK